MTTTANSTPTGFPKFDTNAISSSVPTNTVQSPVMSPAPYSSQAPVTPTVTGPSVVSIAPPSPDITTLYNPTNGTTTQKQADATYTDKLLSAVSSTWSVPSTDITKGTSFTTAGAKRSANETALQQYLDQQKAFQDKYLSAITPTAEETALQKRVNELKTQAGLNQEQALLSGETSSFAGGEAQRVGRTDALKLAGAAEALQALQVQRENTLKQLQYLQSTNDGSFKTQLEIQKLQNEVSGIDKQAEQALGNLLAKPEYAGVEFTQDPTKTPSENLQAFRKLISEQQATTKSYTSDPDVANLYNMGLISGGTDAERQARANRLANLPEDQKKQAIRTLALNSLNTAQQAKYQTNQLASSIVDQALANFDTDLVNNPYKYAANTYSGYLGGKKDPKYTQFMQLVESVNAPIRQGFFGASLTVGEQNAANSFLIDKVKDDPKTIVIKLNNLKSIADFTNDLMIYDQIGGERPKLDDYLKLDKNGNPKQQAPSFTPEQVKAFDARAESEGWTKEEIDAFKKKHNILTNVGSDTNPATVQEMTVDGGQIRELMKKEELLSPITYKVEIPKVSALAYENNNPGNLRFAGQEGAVKGRGGFAKFKTPEDGIVALTKQIQMDINRGHTLESFIKKFAPPTENDTSLYIQQAMKELGVPASTPLSKIDRSSLLKFMAKKESSTKIL